MVSLDQRYLRFRDATAGVFASTPELESLRHLVFKELLVRRRGAGAVDVARHLARGLLRRPRPAGPLRPAEVLLWVESTRSEFAQTILPLRTELEARAVSTQVVAGSGVQDVPSGAHRIAPRIRLRAPRWARRGWAELTRVEPELSAPSLRRAFLLASCSADGLHRELQRVVREVRPQVVVNANATLRGGAALAVETRRAGATGLTLQHGIPQAFYTPVLDDAMLTWGEASNEVLAALGVPCERLVVVGSPRHDGFEPADPSAAKAKLCESLGLPVRPTLVFFSNGNDLDRNGSAPAECARWLEAAAARAPGATIVVRLHPNESGELYAGCDHLTLTKGTPDLETTLAGADVVSSLCSTVLYEGLLYRKPVWQLHADGWPELADTWRQGLATRVGSETELCVLVAELGGGARPGAPGSALVDRVFANRARAAARAAEVVESAARRRG